MGRTSKRTSDSYSESKKKRKRDDVSDTLSEDSERNIVFDESLRIKREVKTPKREIKTPKREIKTPRREIVNGDIISPSRIKKERKNKSRTPQRDIISPSRLKRESRTLKRDLNHIKQEVVTSNSSSDEKVKIRKSGKVKKPKNKILNIIDTVSNKVKSVGAVSSDSESERTQTTKKSVNNVSPKVAKLNVDKKRKKKTKTALAEIKNNNEYSESGSDSEVFKNNNFKSENFNINQESLEASFKNNTSKINLTSKKSSSEESSNSDSDNTGRRVIETEIKQIENKIRLVNEVDNQIKEHQHNNSKNFIEPYDQLSILYPDLKKVTTNINFDVSNSDVYLVKIPRTIDLNNLLDVRIDPSQTSKIRIGKEKYILQNSDKIPEPKLLVTGDKSNMLKLKGNIFMKKYFKPSRIPELEVPDRQIESLPNSLKLRHPLFGSNFKDKLHLNVDVRKRLKTAIASKLKQDEKTRTPKKKKKTDSLEMQVDYNMIFARD